MTFLRIKTVKNRQYLYRQTSVRKGKKVRSVMEYVCALGWIAAAAASPGHVGSRGHKSTDKRAMKHQDQADRERFKKEMENPRERFMREAAKAAAARAGRPTSKPDPEFLKSVEEIRAFCQTDKKDGGSGACPVDKSNACE